ncbi:hypothetical protein Tco_0656209 [Tanacetum coccineum]|uniref:Uncharacterized protein n=1 Tax=Tanacetum coccineum TaxID=301880 RepID=A0ABQ4X846_9ASTR
MFLYMDQLQKQLDNEESQEIGSMSAFKVLETQLKAQLRKEPAKRACQPVNERLMQTTEKVDSSISLDASNIRPIYNEEPMAEVQTTDDNVSATGQQHPEQPEFSNEGKVDQNAEQCTLLEYRFSMSSDNASSAVTYTSVSSDSNGPSSWGIPLVNAGELPEIDPYEEVAQQGQAHPLSPAYVPDPMELDEHVPVYVSEPERLEYHAPSDDDIQVEDQPYADDASPTVKSPGYIADSDWMEEDTDEDSINYPDEPEDGEEDDDEDPKDDPSEEHKPEDDDDDDDIDDADEEPTEDEEEEEYLALADSFVVPVVDPVPSAKDTKTFETDESAPM